MVWICTDRCELQGQRRRNLTDYSRRFLSSISAAPLALEDYQLPTSRNFCDCQLVKIRVSFKTKCANLRVSETAEVFENSSSITLAEVGRVNFLFGGFRFVLHTLITLVEVGWIDFLFGFLVHMAAPPCGLKGSVSQVSRFRVVGFKSNTQCNFGDSPWPIVCRPRHYCL